MCTSIIHDYNYYYKCSGIRALRKNFFIFDSHLNVYWCHHYWIIYNTHVSSECPLERGSIVHHAHACSVPSLTLTYNGHCIMQLLICPIRLLDYMIMKMTLTVKMKILTSFGRVVLCYQGCMDFIYWNSFYTPADMITWYVL